MGLFTFAEIRRLKKALDKAERKLEASEAQRERERASHYRLILNMVDRWHTTEKKTYAVSMGVDDPIPEAKPIKFDPFADWTPEQREFDIKCFEDVGHPDPEQAAKDAYIRNYVEQSN